MTKVITFLLCFIVAYLLGYHTGANDGYLDAIENIPGCEQPSPTETASPQTLIDFI